MLRLILSIMDNRGVSKVRYYFGISMIALFSIFAFTSETVYASQKNECIVISTPEVTNFAAPGLEWMMHIEPFIKELYKRAGLCVEYKPTPLARSEKFVQSGHIDGEFLRSDTYIDLHDSILPIVPAILKVPVYYIYRKPEDGTDIKIEDLKGKDVILIRSIKWMPPVCVKYGCNPVFVQSYQNAIKMLERGRYKLLLISDAYLHVIKDNDHILSKGFTLSKSFDGINFHHVLGRDHEDLIPKLNQTMREMQMEEVYKDLLIKFSDITERNKPKK